MSTVELAAILLPVMAFIALVAGLVVVFRGTSRIAARTREINQFRSGVKELAGRVDASLESAVGRIDAVRHNRADPSLISQTVVDATEALEGYAADLRALRGPQPANAIRDDLVFELARASRALAMVEHGSNMLTSSRRSSRDLEAQTSIKRGYLNLIHAREAIARHTVRADDLRIDQLPMERPRLGV
jgi:hypothetical protein